MKTRQSPRIRHIWAYNTHWNIWVKWRGKKRDMIFSRTTPCSHRSPTWLRSWRKRVGSPLPSLRGCLWGDGDESKSFILADGGSLLLMYRKSLREGITDHWYINFEPCRMHGVGRRYSHWVWSSAAVALLADDGCAEVLGVGERESVERLQGR